jgi:hypothetical protein
MTRKDNIDRLVLGIKQWGLDRNTDKVPKQVAVQLGLIMGVTSETVTDYLRTIEVRNIFGDDRINFIIKNQEKRL